MIDGITIMSETTRYTCYSPYPYLAASLAVVFFIATIIAVISWEEHDSFVFFAIIVSLFVASSISTYFVYKATRCEYKEYKITVSDDVKFNDFINKYKIIDKDGEIFTISCYEEGDDNNDS